MTVNEFPTKNDHDRDRARFLAIAIRKEMVRQVKTWIKDSLLQSPELRRPIPIRTTLHKFIDDLCRVPLTSDRGTPEINGGIKEMAAKIADDMEVEIRIKPKHIPLTFVEKEWL